MDLNRIIQALKGTIDPKLRIAAENELNQVRSRPAAPSASGCPGCPSSAPLIATPTGARSRALLSAPAAPRPRLAALPGSFLNSPRTCWPPLHLFTSFSFPSAACSAGLVGKKQL